MRLLVAISVLVLVLAAHSDAQEAEATIEQRFTQFQQQIQTLTDDIAEKTKTALEQFQTSEFATKTKSFFTEQFEKIKAKMEETFPNQN
ncbi:apolipoprotein C-I [Alosa pseudoharengus]|uniref:apolipoprotein C-I n=1 Tax=Alosa pseudoharengus TaxID=34774 RepID=UPI003F8B1C45